MHNYPLFFFGAFFFFLTSIFSLFFLSHLGMYGIFLINFYSLLFFFLSMIIYIKQILFSNYFYYINLGKWMFLSTNLKINFDFFIDNISFSFSLLTTSIALFVYIFTFSYFRYEPLVDRLLVLLNLFVISMVFLVSSGNLINLFLGWEMIGLTSFYLINFWTIRIGTFKSAFKAFSFNKFSDLFFFFSIILIFNAFYSLDLVAILSETGIIQPLSIRFLFFEISYIDLICIFLLLCSFIKSAQIGSHIWLPDSMEAPVPASALIHSATLVSAGIFILLRFSPFFELSQISFYIISCIGSLTAFYGGLVAVFQSDSKRLLAYSTVSHCGYLMVIYTTGVLEYVLLYLYIHGFFKAATFMCVGNITRLSKDNQDYRKMGMYYKYLPFDCCLIVLGLLNLSGIPFTVGFYMKHLLLISVNFNMILYDFVYLNCIFGAITSLCYVSKLFYYVFFDFKKARKNLYLIYLDDTLTSKYYCTTTIAGHSAVSLIFIIAYIICFKLLNFYLSLDFSFSSFFSFFFSNVRDNLLNSNTLRVYNFGFINYYIVFFINLITFSNWRYTNLFVKPLSTYFNILIVLFIFNILKCLT